MFTLTLHCSFCAAEFELGPRQLGGHEALAIAGPSVLPTGWRLYTVQCSDLVLPQDYDSMAEALHEAYDSTPNARAFAPMVAQLEHYKVPLTVTLLVCAECVGTRSMADVEDKLAEVRVEREARVGPGEGTPEGIVKPSPLREVDWAPESFANWRGQDDEDPPF